VLRGPNSKPLARGAGPGVERPADRRPWSSSHRRRGEPSIPGCFPAFPLGRRANGPPPGMQERARRPSRTCRGGGRSLAGWAVQAPDPRQQQGIMMGHITLLVVDPTTSPWFPGPGFPLHPVATKIDIRTWSASRKDGPKPVESGVVRAAAPDGASWTSALPGMERPTSRRRRLITRRHPPPPGCGHEASIFSSHRTNVFEPTFGTSTSYSLRGRPQGRRQPRFPCSKGRAAPRPDRRGGGPGGGRRRPCLSPSAPRRLDRALRNGEQGGGPPASRF